MSSADEPAPKEEKVEVVNDVESFDFTNDVYRKTYGSDTIEDAQTRTAKMMKDLAQTARQPSTRFINRGLEASTNAQLSRFEKEKVYANEWTNTCLDVVEKMMDECQKAAAGHIKAALACRKKYRMLSIPLIFVTTAATALSFLSAGSACSAEEDGGEDGVKIGVAVLTSIGSIGAGVSTLYSFSNKMTEHVAAGGAFTNLARRIRCQLYLPNHLRAHAEVCLVDFGAEQSHLVNTSPLL